jgi:hypothetical protein
MSETKIAMAASGIIALIADGKEIFEEAAKAMDRIEAQGTLSGADKKKWVLEFVKQEVLNGNNWAKWSVLLMRFIDELKSMYNTFRVLF